MPFVQACGGQVNATTQARHTEYFCEAYISEDNRLRLKYRPGNNKKISLPANLKLTYVDGVLVSAEVL